MFKLSLLLLGMFLFVGCSSIENKKIPPTSVEYLNFMNEELSEKEIIHKVKIPQAFSSITNGNIVTSSKACTTKGVVEDKGNINFYFKRYCKMYDGVYGNYECIGNNNEIIFTTTVEFSRSCTASHPGYIFTRAFNDDIYIRTLSIIKPLEIEE